MRVPQPRAATRRRPLCRGCEYRVEGPAHAGTAPPLRSALPCASSLRCAMGAAHHILYYVFAFFARRGSWYALTPATESVCTSPSTTSAPCEHGRLGCAGRHLSHQVLEENVPLEASSAKMPVPLKNTHLDVALACSVCDEMIREPSTVGGRAVGVVYCRPPSLHNDLHSFCQCLQQ